MQSFGKFFGALLRFNLVALTIVACVALVALGKAGLEYLGVPIPDPRAMLRLGEAGQRPVVLNVEDGYVLGPATSTSITKSGEALYALDRVQSYEGVVYPPQPTDNVNYLSVDRKTNASRWLFKGNQQTIIATVPVYGVLAAKSADGAPVVPWGMTAFIMVVVEADTNKDGTIGLGDRESLYVYKLDGQAPLKILTADKVQVPPSYDTDPSLVFYQEGKQTFVVSFSAPDFKLQKATPVAGMPKLSSQIASPVYGAAPYGLVD
jgi:hypothetical protein